MTSDVRHYVSSLAPMSVQRKAEDAECFWRAWENGEAYRGSFNSVDGQLAVMCYNICLDTMDTALLKEGDSCLLWLYRQQDHTNKDRGIRGYIPNAVGQSDWHTRYPIWTMKYLIDAIDLRLQFP